MKDSIQLVFDLGEYEPRKSGNQSAFEKDSRCIEVMQALVEIVEQSFKDTKARMRTLRPMEIGRNDFSNRLNGFIAGRMWDRFPQYRKLFPHGRKGLRFDGYQIFFKRLYGTHLPKHGPSENSFALERNLQHKQEASTDSIIWMGWHIASDRSRVTSIYATHKNQKNKWHVDILDFLANGEFKRIPVEPIKTVSPKLKDSKQKKQNKENQS